jgi:hypothetical protein
MAQCAVTEWLVRLGFNVNDHSFCAHLAEHGQAVLTILQLVGYLLRLEFSHATAVTELASDFTLPSLISICCVNCSRIRFSSETLSS